jgi:hypothetical protein
MARKIFNDDETGFSLNTKPQKTSSEKGRREVINFTSAEHGKNDSVVVLVPVEYKFLHSLVSNINIKRRFASWICSTRVSFPLYQ